MQQPFHTPRFAAGALLLLGAVLCLPIVSVLLAAIGAPAAALAQMAQTVLPRYAMTSLWLCLGVAIGSAVLGLGAAVCVALFEFPGRRWLVWALLLPLAMPGYVLAYAYTDFLQFSGPLQSMLREQLGLQGRLLPEIRSTGGAVLVLSLALYPYVYVLARAALAERAGHLMEAARLMGVPLRERVWRVAMPLARPAVAAGVALALMETLADFGVVSYFGVQSFTAGVYKAWLAMDDRLAAVQLAVLLLLCVAVLLKLERRAQAKLRFAGKTGGAAVAALQTLTRGQAWLASFACALPVLLGFVLPLTVMLWPLLGGGLPVSDGVDAAVVEAAARERFWRASGHSLLLALVAAALTLAMATALAASTRLSGRARLPRAVSRLAELGYATPGAVIVVGLLLPMAWIQASAPSLQAGYWMTATVLGLLWAYTVRFSAVALQAVEAGYARLPLALDESARMLGACALGIFARVHWPQLRRPLAAAGLLVFVDVMKELPATLVLRPFNTDTLAVLAHQLAKDERLAEAALPCLAIVAVGLLPVLLLNRLLDSR